MSPISSTGMFSATAGATAYSITSLAWPRQVASPPNASRWVQTMRTITPSGFESVGTRMSAQPANDRIPREDAVAVVARILHVGEDEVGEHAQLLGELGQLLDHVHGAGLRLELVEADDVGVLIADFGHETADVLGHVVVGPVLQRLHVPLHALELHILRLRLGLREKDSRKQGRAQNIFTDFHDVLWI